MNAAGAGFLSLGPEPDVPTSLRVRGPRVHVAAGGGGRIHAAWQPPAAP